MLANIAAATAGQPGALAADRRHRQGGGASAPRRTGERGLAGAFNSAIARLARDDARRLIAEGKTVKFFVVGRKGYDILRRQYADRIVEHVDFRNVKQITFAEAKQVADRLLAMFDEGAVRRRDALLFALPLGDQPGADGAADHPGRGAGGSARRRRSAARSTNTSRTRRRSSPSSCRATSAIQIFKALLENAASFYGAQMSAMDNATRNAGDMIDRLTLSYNRQRQAQITKELIEIISGAEAV